MFSVLPGADSLAPLVDSYQDLPVDGHDRAFLFAWICWRLTEDPPDDEAEDLEAALTNLGDVLFEDGQSAAMGPILGFADLTDVSVLSLRRESESVIYFARGDAGVGPASTLYALLVAPSGRCLEVVLKPEFFHLAANTDAGELKRKVAEWFEQVGRS